MIVSLPQDTTLLNNVDVDVDVDGDRNNNSKYKARRV